MTWGFRTARTSNSVCEYPAVCAWVGGGHVAHPIPHPHPPLPNGHCFLACLPVAPGEVFGSNWVPASHLPGLEINKLETDQGGALLVILTVLTIDLGHSQAPINFIHFEKQKAAKSAHIVEIWVFWSHSYVFISKKTAGSKFLGFEIT